MTAIEKRNLPAEPIVVADDDPAQLEEISDYLRRRGHDVVEARDGFSALAAIKKYQPRIALIDVNMPNWDGVRVAEVASSFNHKLALILFSGDSEAIVRANQSHTHAFAVI